MRSEKPFNSFSDLFCLSFFCWFVVKRQISYQLFKVLKNTCLERFKAVKWLNMSVIGVVIVFLFASLFLVSASLVTLPKVKGWQTYQDMCGGGWQLVSENMNGLNTYKRKHMAVVDATSSIFMSGLGLKNEYVGPELADTS